MNRLAVSFTAALLAALVFLAGRWSVRPPSARAEPRTVASLEAGPPTAVVAAAASHVDSSDASPRVMAERRVRSLADDDSRQKALEAWAETDPVAAMAFARAQLRGDRRAQAVTAILSAWGRNDPQGAWNWVTQTEPDALYHYDTLLEVFGRASTATALQFASQYSAEHPAAAVEVHLAALLGITYRGDFDGARAAIDRSALADDARGTLINFVAGQWARYDPSAAAAWAATLPPGRDRDQALVGLGESWSEVDPAAAARYAADLPSGQSRTLAMRQAIAKWVMDDAEAARAWVVQTQRHEDFDQAVGAIATDTNLVNRDPQRALRWAATIFDDKLRQQSIETVVFNWFPSDPAAATRYVQSAPELNADQRTALLTRLRTEHPQGG